MCSTKKRGEKASKTRGHRRHARWHARCLLALGMQPTPLPRPNDPRKPGLVESIQESDLKRWSPRRAGLPPLFDWWPSYVALAALALLAVLAASRLLLDTLVPFAHVLLVFSLASALTFALSPLIGGLEERMPRTLAVALVFVGLILSLAALALLIAG